jgi:hypothetical protein
MKDSGPATPPLRLSTKELCARIRKSQWWVYTNREREGITGFKVGREWLFPIESIEAWESRNTY